MQFSDHNGADEAICMSLCTRRQPFSVHAFPLMIITNREHSDALMVTTEQEAPVLQFTMLCNRLKARSATFSNCRMPESNFGYMSVYIHVHTQTHVYEKFNVKSSPPSFSPVPLYTNCSIYKCSAQILCNICNENLLQWQLYQLVRQRS